jgi:hypothetical protein
MASRKPRRDWDDTMAPRNPNKRYPAYNVQPQRPKKKAAPKKPAPKTMSGNRMAGSKSKPKVAGKMRTR